jgi:hypothetical protein
MPARADDEKCQLAPALAAVEAVYRVNKPSRMALVTACAELTQSSL